MNLILLRPEETGESDGLAIVRLAGRRLEHLTKVLKSEVGDSVRVGVLGGLMGRGEIVAISRREAVLAVRLDSPPPPRLSLSLILALPRPIMLKRVLAQAAALGVQHLFLINARRVEKSFFAASPAREGDFSPYLENGLEQAMDTVAPTVSVHPRFRPFVEDVLPGLAGRARLLAHPAAEARSLSELVPRPPLTGPILLAIGPEGGWQEHEVAALAQVGFVAFSLGPRILRVDTAVPALIAQLGLLLGRG